MDWRKDQWWNECRNKNRIISQEKDKGGIKLIRIY